MFFLDDAVSSPGGAFFADLFSSSWNSFEWQRTVTELSSLGGSVPDVRPS
jgi:hypothetical protein